MSEHDRPLTSRPRSWTSNHGRKWHLAAPTGDVAEDHLVFLDETGSTTNLQLRIGLVRPASHRAARASSDHAPCGR